MPAHLHNPRPVPVSREIYPGVWLDARLAVWLASERLLVVADMHWGYAASHRARGNLLPWWGDDEIEQRLRAILSDYDAAEMIWLGDAVHAAEGGARAEEFLRESPLPVTVVAGNHDRQWRRATIQAVTRGEFFFHHGDAAHTVPAGCTEVIGHHHPAVIWNDGAGGSVRLPALVAGPRRFVLPALSPWAAGTRWPDAAGETVWAISPTRIFALPPAKSLPIAATV